MTKTRDIVIIAVVATLLMALGWYVHGITSQGVSIAGIKLGGATAVTELALDPGEDQLQVNENGPYVMGAVTGSVGGNSGTSSAAWRNLSGHDMWVSAEWAIVPTNGRGVASSTIYFEIATSSDSTSPLNSFYPKPSIVFRTMIATGTGAMYRSSLEQSVRAGTSTVEEFSKLYGNADNSAATTTADYAMAYQRYDAGPSRVSSLGWVRVRPLEYVVVHVLDNSINTGSGAVCSATLNRNSITGYVMCENATSTALGIKIDYTLLTRATTTLPQ